MCKPRPALFKWRHFEPVIIVCAVRWYLRYSLSYRDVQELVTERGLSVDHTTIWRWVQQYAPELNQKCRRELKPTNGSWRVDETYIRVLVAASEGATMATPGGATAPSVDGSLYARGLAGRHTGDAGRQGKTNWLQEKDLRRSRTEPILALQK